MKSITIAIGTFLTCIILALVFAGILRKSPEPAPVLHSYFVAWDAFSPEGRVEGSFIAQYKTPVKTQADLNELLRLIAAQNTNLTAAPVICQFTPLPQ